MYFVVRKDHPLGLAHAMALAGAGAVRCVDRFAGTARWQPAFDAWQERPRKVALRAGAAEMAELARELEAAAVETDAGVTLLCLPPRRRSESEPLLAALRPYTDGPRPDRPPPPPDGPAVVYVVRPGVLKTAGKAMAQAGHAALMCVGQLGGRHPAAFAAWRRAGEPGEVREADAGAWERLKALPEAVVVRDAGLTQVEPGTETVLALAPLEHARAAAEGLPAVG
jgi:peptidyl-tRNA hydrolase